MTIHSDYPCDPRNYQRGRTQKIQFLVIHYVGALGGAKANALHYRNNKPKISAHYFVGHAKERAAVYQSVQDGDTAWHCGRPDGKYKHPVCRNANSIGIEMCCRQDNAGRWYFDSETVDRTVELARDIMARHHIPVDHVLRHYDVTGKRCPAPFVENPAAWAAFKQRLEEIEMTQDEFNKLFSVAMRDYEFTQAKARNRPVSPCHAGDWADAERLGLMDGSSPAGVVLREQLAAVGMRLYRLCKEGV